MVDKVKKVMQKMKNIIVNHKKVCIIAGVIILAVLIFGGIKLFQGSGWTEGGDDTSAPFRYRLRAGNTIEVRVSTEAYEADRFVILTNDSEQLQSESKGKKGSEMVYQIKVDSDTTYTTWSLAYYASEEDQENDEKNYQLVVEISRDENDKCVVTANAAEETPSQTIATDACELSYQLEGDYVEVELTKPENTSWKTEYDESILSVEDMFAASGTTTATIRSVAEGDWETTLVFYHSYAQENDEETRDLELKLHVKGNGDTITEITQEE